MSTELNKVKPDFESIVQQLEQKLQNADTWKDILAAGTGQTLIEFIAAATAYDQHSIERALHETMLDTARLPSSIYTITRMLGVHITRKKPAKVEVELTRSSNIDQLLSIPAYSEFIIDGINFFNRVEVVFNKNQTSVDTTLYQGSVYTKEFVSDGSAFQRFSLGEPGFNISDDDLNPCQTDIGKFKPVRSGIWQFSENDQIYYENTLQDGDVEIFFGNDIYGKIPPKDSTLVFTYAWTYGIKGNDARSGLSVESVNFDVSGSTTSSISNGDDENSAEFYRVLAPDIYSAKRRVVSRKDHRAITVSEYPGVLDAIFRGQQEINPSNKNYMNIVFVTLLTETSWSDQDWNDFIAWLEDRQIVSLIYERQDPNRVDIDIDADVYVNRNKNLNEVKNSIEQEIDSFFEPRLGTLGYSIYVNDIHNLIKEAVSGIDYVSIKEPLYSYEISSTDYIALGNVNINMYYTRRDRTNNNIFTS